MVILRNGCCENLLFELNTTSQKGAFVAKACKSHMDDLTMNIILPVRSDWLISHFASPTEPLPVSVRGPATFAETAIYYLHQISYGFDMRGKIRCGGAVEMH